MPLSGVFGKPYIDLSSYIDLTEYDKLHPTICRNIVEAKACIFEGTLYAPENFLRMDAYSDDIKSLLHTNYEFMGLPDEDPIKNNGSKFQGNDLTTYLKFAMGAYDPYSFYLLYDFKEGWRNNPDVDGSLEAAKYFPEVMNWVKGLVEKNIFSHIGRVVFFLVEHGGISIQHSHHEFPAPDPFYPEFHNEPCEFIHVQHSTDRKFFVSDEHNQKTYIDSRVSWFNDKDWHGGDPIMKSVYSLRVDGVFTESFKDKIK
jgi:hypothetical protein